MSRHVDRQLAAYVEGQLNRQQAARVHEHIVTCDACREKLAGRERFAADLRLALGQSPFPREAQVRRWWHVIAAARPLPAPRSWLPAALLPASLSLLIVLLPVILGAGHLTGAPAAPSNTAISPVADTTNLPPAEVVQTEEPGQSHASAEALTAVATQPVTLPGDAAPPIPAPLAP